MCSIFRRPFGIYLTFFCLIANADLTRTSCRSDFLWHLSEKSVFATKMTSCSALETVRITLLCKVNALQSNDERVARWRKRKIDRRSTFRLQTDDDIEINGIAECRNNFSSLHIHPIWVSSFRRVHHPVAFNVPNFELILSSHIFCFFSCSLLRSLFQFFISFRECVHWIQCECWRQQYRSWFVVEHFSRTHKHTYTNRRYAVVVICTNKMGFVAVFCCQPETFATRAQN